MDSKLSSDTFTGDELFRIDCTGDAVTGDKVRFSRAVFLGNYKKPEFIGYEIVTGEIIKDSYGKDKQQHTFTIRKTDDTTTRIKGRNLYRHNCYRMPWDDESQRRVAREEKHTRGLVARRDREIRRDYEY